ncbi:MAG: isochorismatase family protein [Planctomycetota bacterium]
MAEIPVCGREDEIAEHDPGTLERWEQAVAPYLRRAPPADPGRSALLVVDVQRYFEPLCRAAWSPIVENIRRAVRACHERSVPVVFTQHGHADPSADGGMIAKWWPDLILEDTRDFALIPDLGRAPEDIVFRKRRYDAFYETGLEVALKDRGVEDVCVAGVMTNVCVETTARSAFVRDFRVRVLLDATTTASEDLHVAALVNLAYGFAHVQRTEEWLESLAG